MKRCKNIVLGGGHKAFDKVLINLAIYDEVTWLDSTDYINRLNQKLVYEISKYLIDDYLNQKPKTKHTLKQFINYQKHYQKTLFDHITSKINLGQVLYNCGVPDFSSDDIVSLDNGKKRFLYKYKTIDFVPNANVFIENNSFDKKFLNSKNVSSNHIECLIDKLACFNKNVFNVFNFCI
jgi:hypothetical protein